MVFSGKIAFQVRYLIYHQHVVLGMAPARNDWANMVGARWKRVYDALEKTPRLLS